MGRLLQHYLSATSIGFNPAIYTVSEEAGRVAVSVSLQSGIIGVPVTLTLSSRDGTATGILLL